MSAATKAAGASAASGRGAGLVYNSTSDTRGQGLRVDWMKIDRKAIRVRRLRRRVDHSARVLDFALQPLRPRRLFVTLTYREVSDWSPLHVASFVKCVREWLRRQGESLSCVWVAELQKRGAMHYHLVLWLPRRLRMPSPDKRGWWPHGMSNVQTARSPIGYLLKYASKGSEGEFPRGARIHGACGVKGEAAREVRFCCAPCWVRDALSGAADIRKVVGGWADRLTGLFVASPWQIHAPGNGVVWAWKYAEVSSC